MEKISSYYLENLSLGHTYFYLYDAKGNKIKEQIEYTDSRKTEENLYEYSGGKLTKQEHYEGNKLTFYKVYEYKGDILVKEKFYTPGEKDFITTEHFYEEGRFMHVSAKILVLTCTVTSAQKGYIRTETVEKRPKALNLQNSTGYKILSFGEIFFFLFS